VRGTMEPGQPGEAGVAPSRVQPTLVRLSSSLARIPAGQALSFAARVSPLTADPGEAPTGVVVFWSDGASLGRAPLDAAGEAVLGPLVLAEGVHAVTATYAGDRTHAAATSAPLPQVVIAAAGATVLLVAAPRPGADGVHLEAQLLDGHTGLLADAAVGRVVFGVGTHTVASAELIDGAARVVVPDLPVGTLRGWYAGDTEHSPAAASVEDDLG
jgi:hypothetical protein